MTENNQDDGHQSKKVKLTEPEACSQDTPSTQNAASDQCAEQPKTTPPATIFCSVEGCPHKETGFAKRPVWYRHMMETHCPWPDGRYYCPFDTCKCHKSGFRYAVHFNQHMEWHIAHKDMLSWAVVDDIADVQRAIVEGDELLERTKAEWDPKDRATMERPFAEPMWFSAEDLGMNRYRRQGAVRGDILMRDLM